MFFWGRVTHAEVGSTVTMVTMKLSGGNHAFIKYQQTMSDTFDDFYDDGDDSGDDCDKIIIMTMRR